MKATGIVRRIDDLGRVVIPKEIRRTMRIREGDPLEIYTSGGGEVIFKKYSPMGEMSSFSADYAAALSAGSNLAVIICDRDHCIAVGGTSKKDLIEKPITAELEKITEERRTYINQNGAESFAVEGNNRKICVAAPIISAGDITGTVVLLENDDTSAANDSDIKLAEVAARFLGSRTE
ncbi:MAG: stage V sporulation T C-terminal domain-containing protein [Acutalibacteraceae bacterium]